MTLFSVYYNTYRSPVINTVLLCSTWLLCIVSIERYLAVCHPIRARYKMTSAITLKLYHLSQASLSLLNIANRSTIGHQVQIPKADLTKTKVHGKGFHVLITMWRFQRIKAANVTSTKSLRMVPKRSTPSSSANQKPNTAT